LKPNPFKVSQNMFKYINNYPMNCQNKKNDSNSCNEDEKNIITKIGKKRTKKIGKKKTTKIFIRYL
jgi:hypothetical protein